VSVGAIIVAIWDDYRHTNLVRIASSLRADMIFGKDAGRGAYDAPRWRVPSRQKEHNMHSTAYAHQLKNGEWEVRLPIPGHLLSDKHPTLHKTKEAADLWIASPDGRKWEEQKLAKDKKS
jgi:hypothetical protein